MKKKVTFLVATLAFSAVSMAQITQEQADTIVKKHLQSELIGDSLLYINVNIPSANGITITTSNEETFTAKYACWTYYVNESEQIRCRYLFVKEDNGNLLEVIASGDLGQSDTSQWKKVDDPPLSIVETLHATSAIRVYPNPTNGELTIDNGELTIENGELIIEKVEIYDVFGRTQKIIINCQSSIVNSIDISHLKSGIYLIKVNNKTIKFVKKI